jgi:hypothetical protein
MQKKCSLSGLVLLLKKENTETLRIKRGNIYLVFQRVDVLVLNIVHDMRKK